MLVRTQDLAPRMPELCTCCLHPVLEEDFATQVWTGTYPFLQLLIPHLRRVSLRVPYCPDCQTHISWQEGGRWFGVILRGLVIWFLVAALVTFFAVFALAAVGIALEAAAVEIPLSRAQAFGLAVVPGVVGGLVAGLIAVRRSFRDRSDSVGAPHTRASASLEVLEWTRGSLLLALHNDAWAREFVKRNGETELLPRRPITIAVLERWLVSLGVLVVLYLAYEAWHGIGP